MGLRKKKIKILIEEGFRQWRKDLTDSVYCSQLSGEAVRNPSATATFIASLDCLGYGNFGLYVQVYSLLDHVKL